MMKKVKQVLQKLGMFKETYQSQMDKFIVSKMPQTVADVERLMREFDLRTFGGSQHGRI